MLANYFTLFPILHELHNSVHPMQPLVVYLGLEQDITY